MAHKLSREALRKNLDFWTTLLSRDLSIIPDNTNREMLLGDIEAMKAFMDEKKKMTADAEVS